MKKEIEEITKKTEDAEEKSETLLLDKVKKLAKIIRNLIKAP